MEKLSTFSGGPFDGITMPVRDTTEIVQHTVPETGTQFEYREDDDGVWRVTSTKDTIKARAGRLGARARWGGERRVVRLTDLSPDARRLVLLLVEADRLQQQGISDALHEVGAAMVRTASEELDARGFVSTVLTDDAS